jgi:hypothetical protein
MSNPPSYLPLDIKDSLKEDLRPFDEGRLLNEGRLFWMGEDLGWEVFD